MSNIVTTIANAAVNRNLHSYEDKVWGFSVYCTQEDSFKIAYVYRHNPHGVKVEYVPNLDTYMVTIFNGSAAEGIDKL
jgi:hypothetical protein